MNKKQKVQFGLMLALIIAVHMAILVGYGMQKEGYHEDEYYSFWSSAGYEEPKPVGAYSWRTGPDLMSQFYVRDGDEFNFDAVVYNQVQDSHPPLYHLCLNVIMSLFSGSLFKWLGIGLNMIYSLGSLLGITFFFYQLNEGKNRAKYALTAAAVYAVAPSVTSSVTFIRMYAMTSMLNVWYACALLMAVRHLEGSRKKFAVWTVIGAAICYMSLLTHYFCLLLPGVLTIFACIYALLTRKKKIILRMVLYGFSMLAGIALSILTYPEALVDIYQDYRGTGVHDALYANDFGQRFVFFSGLLNKEAYGRLLPGVMTVLVIACVAVIIYACRKWKELDTTERRCLYLYGSFTAACFISAMILIKISLFLNDGCRYFYPVLAVFLPLTACFVIKAADLVLCSCKAKVSDKCMRMVWAVLAVLFMVPSVAGHMQGAVKFLYIGENEKIAFAQEYKEYPALMLFDTEAIYRTWYRADQIWDFHNIFYTDYAHLMVDTFDEPTIQSCDKLVVFMDAPTDVLDKLIEINPNLDSYTLVRHDDLYYVYLLE